MFCDGDQRLTGDVVIRDDDVREHLVARVNRGLRPKGALGQIPNGGHRQFVVYEKLHAAPPDVHDELMDSPVQSGKVANGRAAEKSLSAGYAARRGDVPVHRKEEPCDY